MLRRRPKNNPHDAAKLRAQISIVRKEKGSDNRPKVQTGVQAGLSHGLQAGIAEICSTTFPSLCETSCPTEPM